VTTINDIIDVVITRNSRNPSRRGFGTALILAYFTAWLDRVRTYSDPADMLTDGFTTNDAAYIAAVSLCSQNPRVKEFKIGRRAGAPTQSIRFTPSTPVATEVYRLAADGIEFAITADATPTIAEITAAFVLLINADTDAIIASGVGSTTGVQNISGASLNGIRGANVFLPARNLTITLNAHADWDATTIVVTGKNASGVEHTEDFLVPNDGGVTLTGTKQFTQVTNVMIPAQSGTNGTLTMGVGTNFGTDLAITATDGTTHFDLAANVAGKWFAYNGFTANLSTEDRTTEPGTTLASDLAAVVAADKDWYALLVADAQSKAQILAAATVVETYERIYVAHSFDSVVPTSSSTDIAQALKDASRFNTTLFYSRNGHGAFPDAAIIGAMLPLDPGSAQWQYKALSGVPVDTLSETQTTFLDAKNATYYQTIEGLNVTLGGKVAGGEWIDIIQSIHYLLARLREKGFATLASPPKLPYTDGGIDLFVGGVRGVLLAASEPPRNILDPASIVVEAPTVAEIDIAERQNRNLPDVIFDARVQGAIVKARIRGTLRP
jgi:hypothetical protein